MSCFKAEVHRPWLVSVVFRFDAVLKSQRPAVGEEEARWILGGFGIDFIPLLGDNEPRLAGHVDAVAVEESQRLISVFFDDDVKVIVDILLHKQIERNVPGSISPVWIRLTLYAEPLSPSYR